MPLHGRTDPRAWDVVLDGHGCIDAFEIETRLSDIQSVERRVMLKSRDDAVVTHVVLVIADTRPLDTRTALAALASGHCPARNGVIVL